MGFLSGTLKVFVFLPFVALAAHASIFRANEVLSFLLNVAAFGDLFVLGTLTSIALTIIYKGKTLWFFRPTAFVCILVVLNQLKDHCDKELLPDYTRRRVVIDHPIENKVTLITGANSGVGFALSKTLVDAGSIVIMACRNKGKCARASKAINDEKYRDEGRAVPMHLDLASLRSTQEFARKVAADFKRLDFLVNNAGFASTPADRLVTEDGFELGFGAMHLGHFLLTKLLMPLLKATADKTEKQVIVVNVASAAGQVELVGAGFDPSLWEGDGEGDLRGEITTGLNMYPRAKLSNILFSKEIARRYDFIRTCSMHVGAVATSIWTAPNQQLQEFVDAYTALIMRSPEEGSRTIAKCMFDDTLPNGVYLDGMGIPLGTNESYFSDSDPASNASLAARLWEVSELKVEAFV